MAKVSSVGYEAFCDAHEEVLPVIEAEVKARVNDPEGVLVALRERASGEEAVYRDVYYDLPDRSLTEQGRELRVRVIEHDGSERVVFTYKAPAVDEETGSKPEHETRAESAQALDAILTGLGYEHLVALTKHCTNLPPDHHRRAGVPGHRGDGSRAGGDLHRGRDPRRSGRHFRRPDCRARCPR